MKATMYVGALLVFACGSFILSTPTDATSAQDPGTAPASTQGAAAPGGRGRGGQAGFSETMPSNDLQVQRRLYRAGNRTYWHTHEKGFLFLVESGHARAQKRGEPMRELGPGDVDYTPPNVLHWHGAPPNDDFVQVGLLFGGGITFADPVTDAEYNGRK